MPRNSSRKRKKKFQGNRYTKINKKNDKDVSTPDDVDEDVQMPSASSRKIPDDDTSVDYEADNYNIIINFQILQSVVSKFVWCPSCNESINLCNDLSKKRGFCYSLSLQCYLCGWKHEFVTSNTTPSSGWKTLPYH